jgi:hypothetical protein
MTSTLKQINARVTDEQLQIIERLASTLSLSKADVIRLALAEYAAINGEDDKPFYDMPQHGGKRTDLTNDPK